LVNLTGLAMDGQGKMEMIWKDPVEVMHQFFRKKKNIGKIYWEPQNLR
jgi:hypothetical protein